MTPAQLAREALLLVGEIQSAESLEQARMKASAAAPILRLIIEPDPNVEQAGSTLPATPSPPPGSAPFGQGGGHASARPLSETEEPRPC